MDYKRIFISGGAGVIGSALVSYLLKENVEIFVGDLKPCPKEWEGKLKYRETIALGLDNAPAAFIGLLKGKNFGKQLVKLV